MLLLEWMKRFWHVRSVSTLSVIVREMKGSRLYGERMTKPALHITAVALSALCLIATPMLVSGDTDLPQEYALQQEDARKAVKAGLVRPLEEILTEVRKSIDGDIVEIEFDMDDGRYIYEIEYVRRDGQLMEMKIDAKTLGVIEDSEDD